MDWKIFVLWFFLEFASTETILKEDYGNEVGFENPYFCNEGKECVGIDHCLEVLLLMTEKVLPVHRFRQLVCGYVGTTPKVCCDMSKNPLPPRFNGNHQDPQMNAKNPECGKSLIRSNMETLGTYPFVARIGFINVLNGDIKYPCNGAIINERTILTTGTCALAASNNYKLHSILLGEYDTSTNPDCNSLFCGHKTQDYDISYVIKHPEFNAETFENNVALIRLKTTIDYTVTIQPICLLSDRRYNIMSSTPILVGWGKISNGTEKPSQQQWLPMQVLRKEECSIYENRGYSVELCAIGKQEPCSGHSGSPLVEKYGDAYTLVGVLSYGSDCDVGSNAPTAFLSVKKYSDWILENS